MMEDTTVPPAAAQEIITATTLLNNAQQCHSAAAHFTNAFRAAPQLADAFAEEFAEAADKLAAHRAQHKSGDEEWRAVAGSYLACINTCPANALLFTRLGVAAHARGKLVEARAAFVKAATLDDAVAAEAARRCGAALIENWHWRMLADTARNEFFAGAVTRALGAGAAAVLDVGCGTGLLAMAAKRAGAARVDAVERCPAMARVCSEVLRLNGSDVRLHCAESTSYAADVKYDVVVAEVVDAALFGEGCLTTLADAATRLAHATTTIIPRRAVRESTVSSMAWWCASLAARLSQHAATSALDSPVGFRAGAARACTPWPCSRRSCGAATRRGARGRASPTPCATSTRRRTSARGVVKPPVSRASVSTQVRLATLDLGELDLVRVALQSVAPRRETPLGEAETVVGTAGRLEGFVVFFELRDGEARLTTAPTVYAAAVPRATSWTQALFHVDAAPVVKKGDVLRLRASVAPDGGIDVLRLVRRRRPWLPFNVA